MDDKKLIKISKLASYFTKVNFGSLVTRSQEIQNGRTNTMPKIIKVGSLMGLEEDVGAQRSGGRSVG